MGGKHALDEVATLDFLDLRINLPVAARSPDDVKFSSLICFPQVALGAKGIAKDEVATQFKAFRRTDVKMM